MLPPGVTELLVDSVKAPIRPAICSSATISSISVWVVVVRLFSQQPEG